MIGPLDMTAEEWNSLVKEEQFKMFPSTRPMPGIIKVLHHLFKNKIPCAVATSCTFKTVAKKTDHLKGLIGYFRHIVSLNDPEVSFLKYFFNLFVSKTLKCKQTAYYGTTGLLH